MTHKSPLHNLSLILIIWLALVLGCKLPENKQGSSGSSSSPSPSASPITVTALALATAYDENEVAADDRYNGKVVLVTGTVESIDTVLGSTSVTLKGKEMSIVSVQCFVDDSQKSAVARLRKGGSATVQGTVDGKSLNVELKDCVVK
jgi:hypothetical protein